MKYTNATAEYHVFEGNNRYSRYRFNEEQAKAAYETLVNCKNCVNCSNLTNADGLVNVNGKQLDQGIGK